MPTERKSDDIVRSFEQALRETNDLRVEQWLENTSVESEQLIVELLHAEFRSRSLRGEACEIAEFTDRYPHLRDRIQRVLRFEEMLQENEEPDPETRVLDQFESATTTVAQTSATTGPQFLNDYQLLEKIGQGGMGVVYRALHRRMDRIVALKILNERLRESPAAAARFEREVRVAAKLVHPNIVTAYDAGSSNDRDYLVSEFVDGVDIQRLLEQSGPLTVEQAVCCIQQVASGLEFAHRHGVIHRDVKPANLMIDKAGVVKILDMGLARLESGSFQTQSGHIVGTAAYMSPEQAEDVGSVDVRSDIYSLGCTLYTLLTGKAVYEGDSLVNLIMAHREQPIPSLCEARTECPAALDRVFHKMVAKDRGNRYASVQELLADLSEVGHQTVATMNSLAALQKQVDSPANLIPTNYPDGSTLPPTPRPQSPRSNVSRWLLAGVLGILVLGAAIVYRIQTSHGTIEFRSFDPTLEIIVKHEGKVFDQFQIQQGSNRTRFGIGEYSVEIKGGTPDGVEIRNNQIVLQRGDEKLVEIVRQRDTAHEKPDTKPGTLVGLWKTDGGWQESFSPNGELQILRPNQSVETGRRYAFDYDRSVLQITEPNGSRTDVPVKWISPNEFVQHQPWSDQDIRFSRVNVQITASKGIPTDLKFELERNKHLGVQYVAISESGGWVFAYANRQGLMAPSYGRNPRALDDYIMALGGKKKIEFVAMSDSESWLVVTSDEVRHQGNVPSQLLSLVEEHRKIGRPVTAADFTKEGAWVAISGTATFSGGELPSELLDILKSPKTKGKKVICVGIATNEAWLVVTEG